MTPWRKAVEDYVELRRSLGFKLLDTKVGLIHFAAFLEEHGAAHITIALALEWAQQDKTARPAEWARRLSFVRGFARHWSGHDSRTAVPPFGLLPHRPGRAHPYLYSNDEIRDCSRLHSSCPRLTVCGGRPITACGARASFESAVPRRRSVARYGCTLRPRKRLRVSPAKRQLP